MIFEHYKMLGCYRLPPLEGISSPRFGEGRKKSKYLEWSWYSRGFEKCYFWHGNLKTSRGWFFWLGRLKRKIVWDLLVYATGFNLTGWLPPLKEIFVVSLETLFNLAYFSDVEWTNTQNTMICGDTGSYSTHVFYSALGEIYPSSTQGSHWYSALLLLYWWFSCASG